MAHALDRPYDEIPRFSLHVAARLAGLSPASVRYYQARGLITPQPMPGGGVGYSIRDVRRLIRIREWRELLGLNLAGIEVALHLRQQVLALQEHLARLEAERIARERTLLAEIQRLRQMLADEGEWFE